MSDQTIGILYTLCLFLGLPSAGLGVYLTTGCSKWFFVLVVLSLLCFGAAVAPIGNAVTPGWPGIPYVVVGVATLLLIGVAFKVCFPGAGGNKNEKNEEDK